MYRVPYLRFAARFPICSFFSGVKSAATVKDFLKKELDLDDVHIAKAFRLGKGRSSGDRPVLVRFDSQGEKARVMKEK